MTLNKRRNWTEEPARSWGDSGWMSRALLGAVIGRARWFEARDLPMEYQRFPYQKTQCLAAALEAARRDPSLRICAGFVFREEVPTGGIKHFWNIDRDGQVVDIALTQWGRPSGYLGGELELQHLDFLARSNRLELPPRMQAQLHADRTSGRRGGRRTRVAA